MPRLSWPEIHGALTHFPIALLITACVFEIAAYVLRKPEGRLISFWLLVGAVLMAIPALFTGWMTGSGMFGQAPSLPPVFVWHRAMAFTTAGIALLLLLWRARTRDRIHGGALPGSLFVLILASLAVSYTGFLGGEMVFSTGGAAPINQNSDPSRAGRDQVAAPTSPSAPVTALEIQAGQKLFQSSGCLNCHKLNGAGGAGGPDLTHESQRNASLDWQIAHLKNPSQVSPGSFMPSYARLSPDQLKTLAAFLITRK
ncbi:MAG TPA: DUF2231 domain-containing protein [Chthonomonadaceae bacterium]|nr:DUF2231 domain-containing protein [Chthonomonadaceae bacterium]